MLAATAVAALVVIVLAGCSFDLGSISLDSLGEVLDSFTDQTSVEDAIAEKQAARTSSVDSANLNEDGVLTVGILSSETAPFLITASDGELTGLDVDVAYALADELGLSVKLVEVSSVTSGLSEGCDIVMGVSAEDADEQVTVVGSYAESAVGVFLKGDATTLDASDLTSATIGVQSSSNSQKTLMELGLTYIESDYSTLNDAFNDLDDGAVDYVACEAYAGSYLATAYSKISFAGTLDEPESIGIALAAGSSLTSSIEQAMSTISSNGVLDIVRASWIGDLPALTSANMVSGLTSSGDAETSTE